MWANRGSKKITEIWRGEGRGRGRVREKKSLRRIKNDGAKIISDEY